MWEQAEIDYMNSMKYKDIAKKYNVSLSTVKSWKTRYKWSRDSTHTKNKKVRVQNEKSMHTKKLNKIITEKLLKTVDENEELTEKQKLFCIYYASNNNATQSYLKAYECNYLTARVEGCKHLTKPNIKAEIKRLKELLRAEIDIDVIDLLNYCMRIIGADISDYIVFGQKEVPVLGMYGPIVDKKTKKTVMQTINYVDLSESSKVDTSVISEVKQGKDGITIKLADKKWAWEQLIKYFDWLPDKWKRNIEERKLLASEKDNDKINESVSITISRKEERS